MTKNKPIIILVEGCNNSGKGTVINKLKTRLLANGMTYKEICQPYFKPYRKILLSGKLFYKGEYEIYKKDRDLCHNIIHSTIKDNSADCIILDRSILSSMIYQGILQNDEEMLDTIMKDASKLYKNLSIDIGVHVIATTDVISNRAKNTVKVDYRDSSDLEKINKELSAYNKAWGLFLSLGHVNYFEEFENNTIEDLDGIINRLDSKILNLYRKKD